jgi:fucose permease
MVTSAIVNNLAPLLFSTFQNEYGISVRSISALIAINFVSQIIGALLTNTMIHRMGHRTAISTAHCAVGVGLIGLASLPALFRLPFVGLSTAIAVYGLGGGIINVVINPIIEGMSGEKASGTRSFIYSFYCWGFIFVIIASTILFSVWGISNWRVVAAIWAIVPFAGGAWFMLVPIAVRQAKTSRFTLRRLFAEKSFLCVMVLMLCAGAAEQSVSQWASLFAESGLGVAKTAGDIAGPCVFAALMGISRILYSRTGQKNQPEKYLFISASACALSYLLAVFSPLPAVTFCGCGMIGLFVGILWPGTLSLSSAGFHSGDTSMFAALILAGNVGCSVGPATVGIVAESFRSIKTGLLIGAISPVLFVCVLKICMRKTT